MALEFQVGAKCWQTKLNLTKLKGLFEWHKTKLRFNGLCSYYFSVNL
jgi:hypothetical protein